MFEVVKLMCSHILIYANAFQCNAKTLNLAPFSFYSLLLPPASLPSSFSSSLSTPQPHPASLVELYIFSMNICHKNKKRKQ